MSAQNHEFLPCTDTSTSRTAVRPIQTDGQFPEAQPEAPRGGSGAGADVSDASACGLGYTPPGYRLLSSSQLAQVPPTKWLVRGVLPAAGLALVYGPSGAGKSFLALDMACSVAHGDPWFGRATIRSPVVYVCLEGGSGMSSRLNAWQVGTGRDLPDSLRVVIQPFRLNRRRDVQQMTSAVETFLAEQPLGSGPPLLVVDTLNRVCWSNFPGHLDRWTSPGRGR
jgi:hypothetical protein